MKTAKKTIAGIVMARRRAIQQYSRAFLATFGVQLGRYLHPLFGFDIVRFDDEITHAKDGESAKDVVERIYGKKAVELILTLIRV